RAKSVAAFSHRYPGWNEFVFDLCKRRFDELLHMISILTFSRKDRRLLDYLEKKSVLLGRTTLQLTHQQIADDLGTSREVISRLLKKLEHEGYLTLQHRSVTLLGEKNAKL
ncbi:MAG: Crp/Fnr family transcriptional regulator, partial [Bacteroidetes bacterium]